MCRASHEGGRRCPGSHAGATARQRRSRARRRLCAAYQDLVAAEEAQNVDAIALAQQRIATASAALSPSEVQAVAQASGVGQDTRVPGNTDHDAGTATGDSEAARPRLIVPAEPPVDVHRLSGLSSKTELLTYPDGTRLVRKQNTRLGVEDGFDPAAMTDAEELAPLVLEACALQTAAVHRSGPVEVYMEFVEGTRGDELSMYGQDTSDISPASVQGRRMGLADSLIINSDRNEENWIRTPDKKLVGLDHGDAWYQFDHPRSPYADPLYDISGAEPRAVPNDFTQADMAVVTERLQALRPKFIQRGRGDWHDKTMRVLSELAAQARGSVDLIAEQS